jgi:hypothetical protein
MRTTYPILLLVAATMCCSIPPTVAATIDEIEGLSFDEAYRLWVPEQQAQVYQIPSRRIGTTDSKTGKFTPTRYWALTCRLGRDAHTHESFLVSALATNEYVSEILETSSRLCSRYGIQSQAAVVFDSRVGYTSCIIEFGFDQRIRRSMWLKAMAKPTSQPDGATNRSQPFRSETNRTPPAAASHRSL